MPKSTVLHLILNGYWWDKISRGEKTVEYRDNTPYYQTRVKGKTSVALHRGYTNRIIQFKIEKTVYTETQIEIHLGKRQNPNQPTHLTLFG